MVGLLTALAAAAGGIGAGVGDAMAKQAEVQQQLAAEDERAARLAELEHHNRLLEDRVATTQALAQAALYQTLNVASVLAPRNRVVPLG